MGADVYDFPPGEDHPALLLARAHELAQQADELSDQAKTMRMQAATLRSRAQRRRDGPARPKREKHDRLLAAAAVAVEDFTGVWDTAQLAGALRVRDMRRAAKITLALETMGLIERVGRSWRAVEEEPVSGPASTPALSAVEAVRLHLPDRSPPPVRGTIGRDYEVAYVTQQPQ